MNKETIAISDLTKDHAIILENLKDFSIIEQITESYDKYKGFINNRVILQRLSDQKYFEVYFTEYGCGNSDLYESELIEVFPTQKTIITYE